MKRFLLIFSISLLVVACGGGDYTPKPRAYLRIDMPEKNYVEVDSSAFPFSFEKGFDVELSLKKNTPTEKWIDLNYPSLKGVVYLNYMSIHGVDEMKSLVDSAYRALSMHYSHCSGIDEQQYYHPASHVSATTYHLKGQNVASSYQFWASDSLHHFLRGALYLDYIPNSDSLSPVIDYIRQDIDHLIETLRWQ